MAEKKPFGVQVSHPAVITEETVMSFIDRLFDKEPTQGFNNMVNAVSWGDRIEAAAIVFSPQFSVAMEQRGYAKKYTSETLGDGTTRQSCVGFSRR